MAKYRFIKDSNLQRPRNVSFAEYSSASYGQEYIYEPVDVPLRIYHLSGSVTGTVENDVLWSLKNTINYYSSNDDIFNFDNFYNKPTNLLSFNSLHLGSGIAKGTVELNVYLSGSKIASASDKRENGVLYDLNDDKVGIVLYNEGFILLNNTSSLSSETVNYKAMYNLINDYSFFSDDIRWTNTFIEANDSVYFDINYECKNEVQTNTYFVFAEKNSLNHSNNQTYIDNTTYKCERSNAFFVESSTIQPKKTNKSPFVSGSAEFEKQTFITNIGLYDKDRKLIGIGSLANPVRKTENREYMFKLQIDI